jgi:2-dehydropantoate 2-reductase
MFEQSGVNCIAIDDLASERWKKLIINIPLNGLSALYNKSVNQLMADNKLCRHIRQLTKEVQQAALAYDVVIEDEVLEKFMINAGAMKPFRTSMQDDMLNHRPMEIEAIIGEPLRRGRQRGVDMPETQRLYDELITLDGRQSV